MLGRDVRLVSEKANICEGDVNDKCLLDKKVPGETSKPDNTSDRELALEMCLTSLVFKDLELEVNKEKEETSEDVYGEYDNFSPELAHVVSTGSVIEDESLAYIGGYIVRKFSSTYPHLGYRAESSAEGRSKSWIEMRNRGQLYMPSGEFYSQLQVMREVFKSVQGESLREGPRCVKTISSELERTGTCLPSEVMEFFARISVFFRIRYLNNIIAFSKQKDAGRSMMRKNNKIIA